MPLEIVCIGIDPGKHGGMAAICPDKIIATHVPGNDFETWKWLQSLLTYRESGHPIIAALEQVSGYMPSRGEEKDYSSAGRNNGSAMFQFGRVFGKVEMALACCEIHPIMVTPGAWQSALGVEPKRPNESRSSWKGRLKTLAMELFPQVGKITLATADALLLAAYCYNKYGSTLFVEKSHA